MGRQLQFTPLSNKMTPFRKVSFVQSRDYQRKFDHTTAFELVSAHMAANLLDNLRQALSRFPVVKEVSWSDSTATLHWIKRAGQYKEFVRNCVAKIREKGNICWRYVGTTQNLSDIGSRGYQGDKLSKVDITTKPQR